MNDLLPLAERLLAEHRSFYPFGGSIAIDGKHIHVSASTGSKYPKCPKLLELLTQMLHAEASEGKIRAGGVCFDVRVVPPGRLIRPMPSASALSAQGRP